MMLFFLVFMFSLCCSVCYYFFKLHDKCVFVILKTNNYKFVLCLDLTIYFHTESKLGQKMTHNGTNKSKQDIIDIKEEISEQLEIDDHNIKQETIVSKRSYYQCITCSATFTKVEKLKGHASIHKGKHFT